jgi:hypothetical protein
LTGWRELPHPRAERGLTAAAAVGATLVAVLAVMGRHERVNPREGAEMIAYLKKQTETFGH